MPNQASKLASVDGFTSRQQELVGLLAEGKSNKEIANQLHIAYGTVKQHLVALFKKLAVTNRHRAVVVAQQILRDSAGRTVQRPAPLSDKDYKWRMLSAVAISLPEPSLGAQAQSPSEIIHRKHWLELLSRLVFNHVEALDGHAMVAHDGSVLAWFGYPIAHLDDTDRCISIAMALRDFARSHQVDYPPLKHLGIGIANQTELIAVGAKTLQSAELFKRAVSLAGHAQRLGYPLMNRLSHRLSHLPLQTGMIKQASPVKPPDVGLEAGLEDARVILDGLIANPNSQQAWGGLPFMAGVSKGVLDGIAQWLSVISWPMSSTASLMTAVAQHPALDGFRRIHLRLPVRKTRDVLLGSLMSQMNLLLDHSARRADSKATAGERLAYLIRSLCQKGPVCLLVHGHNGLMTLRNALADKGVEILAAQPLLVIGQAAQGEKHEAVIQTLGARATGVPFSRSYVLTVPDSDEFVARLKMEVAGILDALSPLARTMLVDAAHHPSMRLDKNLPDLDESTFRVQEALQELQSIGLIIPAQGGGFQFRDPILAEAICQMDVQLEDASH